MSDYKTALRNAVYPEDLSIRVPIEPMAWDAARLIERLREELKMRDSRTYSEQLEWNEELSGETDSLNKRIEVLEADLHRSLKRWHDSTRITKAQIDAAVSLCLENPTEDGWHYLRPLNIERCGCADPLYCQRCKDHGWVREVK